MKAELLNFARRMACLLVVLACLGRPGTGLAQDPPPIVPPPGAEAAPADAPDAPASDVPPGEAPPGDAPPADDGLVAVNLKNVDIENIVKFLSEITGKAVL